MKSPRDVQEQSLEEMTTTCKDKEKRKSESSKEEQSFNEPDRNETTKQPTQTQLFVEDETLDTERLMSSSGSSIGSSHQQHKLSKTQMSLSQPHLVRRKNDTHYIIRITVKIPFFFLACSILFMITEYIEWKRTVQDVHQVCIQLTMS